VGDMVTEDTTTHQAGTYGGSTADDVKATCDGATGNLKISRKFFFQKNLPKFSSINCDDPKLSTEKFENSELRTQTLKLQTS
jgi:hypothetical protein